MDNDQSRPFPNAGSVPGMNTAATQPMQQASADEEDEGLALGEIIAVLMDYRWLIAAISLFALALGLAWVLVAKPVYRADGLLQIEEKGSGGALKALRAAVG
jgi:uncharacterized protein involved in exopolysaccharide biosynthesis